MHSQVKATLERCLGQPVALERPKQKDFGHFATPASFSLAKTHRKAPRLIAEELAEKLKSEPIFDEIVPINGYINLHLSESFLNEYATGVLQHPESFGKGESKNQKILLEFVSANPTGPLHIGHARGAIFGDALLRMGRHLGYEITSEYYVNDAGNQIHLLGLSLYLSGRETLGLPVEWPESYYRGEYIKDLSDEAMRELGESLFQSEDSIPELSAFGKEKMLEEIKQNLAETNISFEHFVSEKGLMERWNAVRAELEKHRALQLDDEGKLWIKSSEHGDEKDRVVVRETGEPTYLAGDIIYHQDKFQRNFDHYINIWGADHHGYIARVKASIAFLGHDPARLEILLSQMVSLLKDGEPYKMSKRAGNFILMKDVVSDIGPDALRFVFLSKKSDTHLEFDVAELSKQDASNPVYYVNYAHARIHTLFNKAEKTFGDVQAVKLGGLNTEGKNLLFLALNQPQIWEDAFTSRQPQKVTDYLKQLAAEFHAFYNANRVIGSDNEDQLLKLFSIVALSIKTGFSLLGMQAKERM